MKYILILLLTISLNADWKSNLKYNHIKLSEAYVEAMEANKKANKICRSHISIAMKFRDEMTDSSKDKEQMSLYIDLVKFYCSQVAECSCRSGK